MSYNTYYHFGTKDIIHKDILYDIIDRLRNWNEDAKYAINEEGMSEQSCTWYEHEKDIKEFSEQYPDIIFELNGIGDEYDDIWNKYFLNGKMQTCIAKIIFDQYDPEKLTE